MLSVEVAPSAGAWVLAIGLARYAFLAAGWGLHWMRAPLPRRDWRKTVTASQGVALAIAAAGVVPTAVTRILLAVALALLAESFGRDVWWLWRHRHAAPARPAAVRDRTPPEQPCSRCLLWPSSGPRSSRRSSRGFSLPARSSGFRSKGSSSSSWPSSCPPAPGAFVPWVIGPLLGLLVLVKLFDLGFFIAFDRPFNPVEDWSYLSIGVGTVRDTFGSTGRRSGGRRRGPARPRSARHPHAGGAAN